MVKIGGASLRENVSNIMRRLVSFPPCKTIFSPTGKFEKKFFKVGRDTQEGTCSVGRKRRFVILNHGESAVSRVYAGSYDTVWSFKVEDFHPLHVEGVIVTHRGSVLSVGAAGSRC